MNTEILQKNLISTAVVLWLVLLICSSATTTALAATSRYIAQTAGGTNDGSSCANARPASWFNTSGNWGTSANQIGPGETVFLCGTITSGLTFQGSGTSGNYITVDGTGATMSGGFSESNRSWWKVQNVTFSSGFSGILMDIDGGSNGVFTGNYSDNFSGDPAVWINQGTSLPNNITISNNYIRQTAANLGNNQHDLIKTEGSTNVIIDGNYLEMRAGGAGENAHNDAIQTFESGSSSSKGNPSNWTIRHNWIVMNSNVTNDRSWTMIQMLGGTNYIYGNVFLGLQGAEGANGLRISRGQSGVIYYIYNNTFVAKNSASNNTMNLSDAGTAYIRNNIVHTNNQTALTGNMTTNRDHNLWFGNSIPSCSGITGELCNQNPLFIDYANNNFSLQSGSPAINAGANLGSPYNGSIAPGASWPNPALGQRPSSGKWTISAYESTGSSAPIAAPTNLRVQ